MLTHLVRWLNLRHLSRQRVRTILSMIGVIMGVSSFIFAPTLATTIQSSLNLTITDLAGKTDIDVRSTENGFDFTQLDKIRATPGVKIAAPLSTSGGLMVGQPELLIFFGIDPTLDQGIRSYSLLHGSFLAHPGDALLSDVYASEKGLSVGSTFSLVSLGGVRQLTVVGTLAPDGVGQLNSGDLVVMGLDDAFALRAARHLDNISILVAPNTDLSQLVTQLKANVPANVTVDLPAERLRGASDFTVVINLLMLTICLMVLGFGSMLIYNTITVSVAQRRAEIGILRSLGMTRNQVIRLYTLEASAVGLIGSFLGVGLGFVLVRIGNQLPLIPQFSSDLFSAQAAPSVPGWLIPASLVAGLLLPTFAGFLASRSTARIDPVEALVGIRAETAPMRYPWRQLAAVGVLLLAIFLIRLVSISQMVAMIMLANTGVMLTLAAIILAVAPLLLALKPILPPLMYRLLGSPGLIAASNLVGRPKRILVTGILLTLCVGCGAYISQSNFGYTDMIAEWNTGENLGDLTVTGAGSNPLAPIIPVPDTVIDTLRSRSDLAGLITERLKSTNQGGIAYNIRAIDMASFRALGGYFPWNQGDSTTAYERVSQTNTSSPAVLVSTNILALSHDVMPGKRLTLDTPSGPQTFDIVGSILGKLEPDRITVIMDRGIYGQLWSDSAVDRVLLKLKPGVDVQTVRRDLIRQFALNGVITYANADVRDAFAKPIVSIATTSTFMTLLLAVIFVAGLSSTVFVQVLERRREIGMLRAVGMKRREITQSVLYETLILTILGIIIGVPGSYILNLQQEKAMQQVMGIRFALNTSQVVISIAIALVTALWASYIPARIAGRMNILEALRYE